MIAFRTGALALVFGFSLVACSGGNVPIGENTGGQAGSTGGSTSSGGTSSGGSSSTGGSSSLGGSAGSSGGGCSTGQHQPGTGKTCTSNADCDSGQGCGFLVADACSATGECFPLGTQCNCFTPGCGCDGSTVDLSGCEGLPDGYAPAPVAHAGLCADGGQTTFACPIMGGSCSIASEYCYTGELAFYNGDAGVTDGCNALPSECQQNPSCACLLKYYQAGFCTCDVSAGGFAVHCSTV